MEFYKQVLAESDGGYAVSTAALLGKERVLAASEKDFPAYYFTPPDFDPVRLTDGPGGSMGFAPVPCRDDALFMITGFYPIFAAESAGINLLRPGATPGEAWTSRRIIELPFVHRISSVRTPDGPVLVAAAVCGGKTHRDDWSQPGTVSVIDIPPDLSGPWTPRVIVDGLRQNHGMYVGSTAGRPCVYVSGTEGVYALQSPEPGSSEWKVDKLVHTAVSEIVVTDIDGDGHDELVTIEPFHGETFAVYKSGNAGYEKIFAAELAFGHGLWAGSLGGRPAALVGNRDGSKDLMCYETVNRDPFEMRATVVDAGSGTANVTVYRGSDGDTIIASNPEHNEYARYSVETE